MSVWTIIKVYLHLLSVDECMDNEQNEISYGVKQQFLPLQGLRK